MRGLPARSSCTNTDILESMKTAYDTLAAVGPGTWIVRRCRKLIQKLMSIVESYVQREGDMEGELEEFGSTELLPGFVDFPLSVSDWNHISIDQGFETDLDHLSFSGGDWTRTAV